MFWAAMTWYTWNAVNNSMKVIHIHMTFCEAYGNLFFVYNVHVLYIQKNLIKEKTWKWKYETLHSSVEHMTQPSIGICRLWNSFCNLGPDCTMVGSHSFCFCNCLWAQLGEDKDAPIFWFLDKSVGRSRRHSLLLRFMVVGGKIELLFWSLWW